jgi:sporulation protein YlmC with PRC-barrel domain
MRAATTLPASLTAVLLAASALATPAASAADGTTAVLRDDAPIVPLSAVDFDRLKGGAWFADELRGARVFGSGGDQIGTVRSIIIDPDGRVRRLVVEAGGPLDIGDNVLAIPWSAIDLTPGEAGVVATNLDADAVDNFSLFEDWEPARRGLRAFRAAEVQGDLVYLRNGEGYGMVRDLMFDRGGQLQAIVVAPDAAYDATGFFAYPYRGGTAFDPGSDRYNLPYAPDEVGGYGPFAYRSWNDGRV